MKILNNTEPKFPSKWNLTLWKMIFWKAQERRVLGNHSSDVIPILNIFSMAKNSFGLCRSKEEKKTFTFAVPDLIPNFLTFVFEIKSKFLSLKLGPSVLQRWRIKVYQIIKTEVWWQAETEHIQNSLFYVGYVINNI